LNQLEPGPHYNDHFDLRLTGPLDVEVLAKALNEVIRRHETLRGTFGSVEGRPVQKVSSTLNLPVPLVDLSELEESERERKAVALAVQETRQLFDLEKGPLLRARLLRLSEREHIFALTFHHIIIDGWSRMVFLRELRAVYEAFRAGGPSPLPGLPIQYSDFAAWQEKWLGGESIARDLAFWRQQLSGVAPVLELPADRPRPPAQSYRGARLPLALDKALLDRVSILGQQEGCTLFMTLLAAFQVLLARYTGRDDIVIGSPIANRNHAEVEGLIGCFLNNLVLRGDLSGDPGFVEILRRVRKVALDAFAHQDLPFEKVVAELQPVRNLGYSPVFQIMFILQNPSAPNAPGGGLTFRPFEIDAGVSKVDLTLNLEEASEAWSGWIEYSTDLFDEARIRRLIEDFRILLEGIVTRPTDRLSQLPPASPKHKEPAPEAGLLQGRTSTDAIDKPVSISRGPRPQTEVEKKLAGIWSEVLGTEKIRLHDSLFDLGGHSLLITMIQSRIRDVFEVEIPLQAFFEMPTLGDISTLIESRLSKRLAHV
jgi:acyl carrier protein